MAFSSRFQSALLLQAERLDSALPAPAPLPRAVLTAGALRRLAASTSESFLARAGVAAEEAEPRAYAPPPPPPPPPLRFVTGHSLLSGVLLRGSSDLHHSGVSSGGCRKPTSAWCRCMRALIAPFTRFQPR